MSPSTTAFIDLTYLPNLEFFVSILEKDSLLVDENALLHKQSAFNRTYLMMTNKVELLSIPLQKARKRQLYRDVKIDYNQKWQQVHLRGIRSAYGKAPFFEYFFPDLERQYLKNPAFLWDLNCDLLTVCLKLAQLSISIEKKIVNSSELDIVDLRHLTRERADYSTRTIYNPHPYPQLFGADFVPNLSIIDLLFCEGPATKQVLELSRKKTLNNP
jgi:hypothetical protein